MRRDKCQPIHLSRFFSQCSQAFRFAVEKDATRRRSLRYVSVSFNATVADTGEVFENAQWNKTGN